MKLYLWSFLCGQFHSRVTLSFSYLRLSILRPLPSLIPHQYKLHPNRVTPSPLSSYPHFLLPLCSHCPLTLSLFLIFIAPFTHCAPTAFPNLISYSHSHGGPSLSPPHSYSLSHPHISFPWKNHPPLPHSIISPHLEWFSSLPISV